MQISEKIVKNNNDILFIKSNNLSLENVIYLDTDKVTDKNIENAKEYR